MTELIDWGDGIYAFDANYVRKGLASIHLVIDNDRACVVDTGSNASVSSVMAALATLEISVDAVDYVVLTHIHLDHAGGAGMLMQRFPNASLVVHPRGARHMAAPERLLDGVRAVYGARYVEEIYGEIVPVPASRIIAASDGHALALGQRVLTCIDTPGHARHHLCVVDSLTQAIFTGDMFGLSYREMDLGQRQFVFPTTTPTQFDPVAMRHSIARLGAARPSVFYLTHYSQLREPDYQADQLLRRLDRLVEMTESVAALPAARRPEALFDAQRNFLIDELRAHGVTCPEPTIDAIWTTDLTLNVQGLLHWQATAQPSP